MAARRRFDAISIGHGEESLEAATAADVLVAWLLHNGKGAQPDARALAERALRIKRARTQSSAIERATSLKNLAEVVIDAGDYRQAVPLLTEAIALREKAADDPGVVDALSDLTYALTLSEQYPEAREAVERSLATAERVFKKDNEETAGVFERQVLLLQKEGKYSEARPPLERALRIRELDGTTGLKLAETLNLSGEQAWFEGRIPAALDGYRAAVAALQKACADDHPRLSEYLRNLAVAMATLGDLEGSVVQSQRALDIAQRVLGPDHPQVAAILNDLALRRKDLGELQEARRLFEMALGLAVRRFGSNHDWVATFVHNLALLNAQLGDLAEAKRLEARAVAIWERLLGSSHPYVATALESLAVVLSDQRRDVEARPLYERALTIRERALPPEHRDLAKTRIRLATTLLRLGNTGRAMRLSNLGLKSLEAGGDAHDLDLAWGLMTTGDLEFSTGDYESARQHQERALALLRETLGDSNPGTAEARFDLARTLASAGALRQALAYALEAEAARRDHVRLTLRYLAERQSLAYAAQQAGGLDLAVSLSQSPADGRRTLDALVRSRSLVLDEMAARQHASNEASRDELAPLWAGLVSARQRYANLVVRGSSLQNAQEYAALVDEARREKETAERALAEKNAAFKTELARGEVGLDAIHAALPAVAALVSYARFDRTVLEPVARDPQTAQLSTPQLDPRRKLLPSYMAFVIRPGTDDVAIVPLGSAHAIDLLVGRWRDETTGIVRAASPSDAERAYRAAGASLRRRIWDPLREYVKDASTVFVVPDGMLNLVSFAALPVDSSAYLIDEGPVFHYLSAERDLVFSNPVAKTGRGLLAVGGAAFDDSGAFSRTTRRAPTDASSPALRAVGSNRLGAECGSFQDLQFSALPGTRREAREIASLWSDSPAELLEDRAASERAFKRDAPGHQVLHVATHGFFLGNCAPGVAGTRSVGGLSKKPGTGPKLGLGESPLLLSGLAFAGANRRAAARPGDDDGILTAEEVTALNLEGVEWAVLSACDTGLGAVKTGEGVFGLRRAFQVAGVRTVIMSLWAVDDQAARLWMRALYEARLRKHLNTSAAMREASLTMLYNRRAHGQSTHPFFWGAFVAVGDWR